MILFIVWILYVLLEGFREAYYWHYKSIVGDPSKFDIHSIFTIQRTIVLVCILTLQSVLFHLKYIDIAKTFTTYCFVFSFIHNGIYYTMRNKLNDKIYTKKWFAQSTTSTSVWTKVFTPIVRTALFVIGAILILI